MIFLKIDKIVKNIEDEIYLNKENSIVKIKELKSISIENNNYYGIIKAEILMCKIMYLNFEYKLALEKLLSIQDELLQKKEKELSIEVTKELGDYYIFIKDFSVALNYYKLALKLLVKYPKKNIEWRIYNNIAVIYTEIKDYNVAIDYYFKALEIQNEFNESINIVLYLNIGETFKKNGEYEVAINYLKFIKDVISCDPDKCDFYENIIDLHLADIYFQMDKIDKASILFDGKIDKIIANAKISMCLDLLLVYCKFLLKTNADNILYYLEIGLQYSKKNNALELMMEFLFLISTYYCDSNVKTSKFYFKEAIEVNKKIIEKYYIYIEDYKWVKEHK